LKAELEKAEITLLSNTLCAELKIQEKGMERQTTKCLHVKTKEVYEL
jgi:hypothetical protein